VVSAFQKSFGRSTKVKAVGSLMLKLRRKAERAGGEFRELNTQALKLSQYDHCTGTCTKKRLSQRWHVLGDGSGVVQRDMYSAFLAGCAIAARSCGMDKKTTGECRGLARGNVGS
jgi:putative transposase